MKSNKKKFCTLIPRIVIGLAGKYEQMKLRYASDDTKAGQARCLRRILELARDTEFGKEHDFKYILQASTYEELYERYARKVSPAEYEAFRPYVEQMRNGASNVLFFGRPALYVTTSGATGDPKWIPISLPYILTVYINMNRMLVYSMMNFKPKVFSGYILNIVGKQVEGRNPDGSVYGSISGLASKKVPWFIKRLYPVPKEVFDIEDYATRNYAIMRIAIEKNVTSVITPNPSTMVEMMHTVDIWYEEMINDIENGSLSDKFEFPQDVRDALKKCLKPNPGRAAELRALFKEHGQLLPRHYWPDQQLLFTWKCGNTSIYLKKLEGAFAPQMRHQELGYFSSECRAGLVLDDSNETVLFPHLHFFEFKRECDLDNPNARFYRLHELEPGKQYCPFVTTLSGLYRYNMNDIVQASEPLYGNAARIHMIQKVNGVISITGEKLYEGQFIKAVAQAQASEGVNLNYFAAYADLENSRYDWYFEFHNQETSQEQAEAFAKVVDENLSSLNIEYAGKRSSFRLKDPAVFRLQKQSFAKFKQTIVNQTRQDATRFKPNVLSQDKKRHEVLKRFILE